LSSAHRWVNPSPHGLGGLAKEVEAVYIGVGAIVVILIIILLIILL
jgi:hypothetical protein